MALWHFGTLSLTALVVNPLVLGLIPLAMGAGFLAATTFAAAPALWLPLRLAAWLPLHFILSIIHLGARWPGFWQFMKK